LATVASLSPSEPESFAELDPLDEAPLDAPVPPDDALDPLDEALLVAPVPPDDALLPPAIPPSAFVPQRHIP
jgi:hypothetical protein